MNSHLRCIVQPRSPDDNPGQPSQRPRWFPDSAEREADEVRFIRAMAKFHTLNRPLAQHGIMRGIVH